MKNKLLGLAACLLALVLAVAAPLALPEHRTKPRVHQHRGALPEAPCTDPEDGGLCTYLPIVEIDTGGVTIPGRPIHSEEGTTSYVLAEDGQTTIAAQMKVIGTDTGEYHHANGTPDVESSVRIRVRGNSSRSFDKPSYAIRLVDAEGGNAPQSLMGMDAHHEWVLYGPWLDKTAVRNYLFYNLAGELMDYAPNVRYCEVIVDGEYQGLYLLAETITAGKNGARLPLEVSAKGRTYSGYLLRLDHNRPETRSLRSFTEYTYIQDKELSLQLEFPGEKNRSEELEQQIRQDFSDFEKALYSYDYDREKYGYASRIDVDSFVDYFILNELAGNVDAGNFSTYLYKGTDGLFRMCVWDFNNACDNYFEAELGHEGFFMPWRLWYWMMMKDEDFTSRIITRYRQLRQGLLSEAALDQYIEETEAFLAPALARNDARWGDVALQASELLQPAGRNLTSRGAAEGQLKGYLHNRGAWMDDNIETLRQYSAPSHVKKFNEVND